MDNDIIVYIENQEKRLLKGAKNRLIISAVIIVASVLVPPFLPGFNEYLWLYPIHIAVFMTAELRLIFDFFEFRRSINKTKSKRP